MLVGDLLEKVKEYYEREYESARDLLEKSPWWIESADETVWLAIQRCLGIAQFIQLCGIDFPEADMLYEEVREKLEKLRD